MKAKFISLALMTAVLIGCADRPQGTPTERATALVKTKNLSEYPVMGLDSVYGYKDVHAMNMAALNLKWKADSIIINQRAQKRLLNPKERDEVSSLSNTIFTLRKDAAKAEMQYRLENRKRELVGLRYAFADSLKGNMTTIYFDTDVTKITGIDRNIDDL